ncbi:MAG TPA: CoA transferase [Alphaproteobacteria bacterium]|nr:CoA transferase [Alphaproteobacteria bacterium]
MGKLPLEGIRILDFTVVWAGPFATMLLADFGAEVIRVESLQYFPSVTRGLLPRPDAALARQLAGYAGAYPERDPGSRPWNRHPMFNPHARNKLGMTVDLSRPKGRELFLKLVRLSDVLVENHSARFMENLGLTYDVLSQSKPDLIMVSMPAFGMSGPYKYYQGFGVNVESVCGLTWLRAYPDGDATETSSTLHMDAASGAGTAFAILAALHYRQRTGKGQFIDFAQAENLMQQIGEILMDYPMNGRSQRSLGNRHPVMAPHGCYPCRGHDRWVIIAVADDAEWERFCQAVGNPPWVRDARFADSANRYRHQDALDAHIAAWTQQHHPWEIMERLQGAGIASGPVMRETDLFTDPHLKARGFFQIVTHPEAGTHPYPGIMWQMSKTAATIRRPAVRLGEDNDYVYRELLKLSEAEIAALRAEGHIGMDFLGKDTPHAHDS